MRYKELNMKLWLWGPKDIKRMTTYVKSLSRALAGTLF